MRGSLDNDFCAIEVPKQWKIVEKERLVDRRFPLRSFAGLHNECMTRCENVLVEALYWSLGALTEHYS
jgi:hypothetical protein